MRPPSSLSKHVGQIDLQSSSAHPPLESLPHHFESRSFHVPSGLLSFRADGTQFRADAPAASVAAELELVRLARLLEAHRLGLEQDGVGPPVGCSTQREASSQARSALVQAKGAPLARWQPVQWQTGEDSDPRCGDSQVGVQDDWIRFLLAASSVKRVAVHMQAPLSSIFLAFAEQLSVCRRHVQLSARHL
jgi:hypothetical protein